MKYLAPDYVYTPQGLQTNRIISISDEGRIEDIKNAGTQIIAPSEIEILPGIALLPGFVPRGSETEPVHDFHL